MPVTQGDQVLDIMHAALRERHDMMHVGRLIRTVPPLAHRLPNKVRAPYLRPLSIIAAVPTARALCLVCLFPLASVLSTTAIFNCDIRAARHRTRRGRTHTHGTITAVPCVNVYPARSSQR